MKTKPKDTSPKQPEATPVKAPVKAAAPVVKKIGLDQIKIMGKASHVKPFLQPNSGRPMGAIRQMRSQRGR